jgi:hypothetical protein
MAAMRNDMLPAWRADSQNGCILKKQDSGLALPSSFLGAF